MPYQIRDHDIPHFPSIIQVANAFARGNHHPPVGWVVQRTHRVLLVRLNGTIDRVLIPNNAAPHLVADNQTNVNIWENIVPLNNRQTIKTWFTSFLHPNQALQDVFPHRTYSRPVQGGGEPVQIDGLLNIVESTRGNPFRVILCEYLRPV